MPIYDYVELILIFIRPYLFKNISLPSHSSVIDIACGTGFMTSLFAQKGYIVTAVDLSPEMLNKAKDKLKKFTNITYYLGSASQLPFKDDEFDASSISFALHDMPYEMGADVLREMIRTTKSGGKIYIIDYNTSLPTFEMKIGHLLCSIWESIYYKDFLKRGIDAYLVDPSLKLVKSNKFLFSNVAYLEYVKT